MRTEPQPPLRKPCALFLASLMLGLAGTCAITSTHWVGAAFPGFFVLANRVIASVSLPHWSIASRQDLYQHAVVAVNGRPIETASELYAAVRAHAPSSPITYGVEKNGRRFEVTLPSRIFTLNDYGLFFLAYLFTGFTIALTGIGVWFLQPANPASQALCIAGVATGIFGITGADLYGPHWFFRLHVLGEAFFPASYLHLALVFPTDRLRRFRRVWLTAPYIVAGVLATAYETFLYQPTLYSWIHNLCMLYVGVAGTALLCSVLWDYWTTDSYLTRQRIRVICLGFLGGYGVPVILMFTSGVTGGEVAVNYMAFTGFLFPLSIGYAIVKHDLFDIDALLKRAAYYLTLTAVLTILYILLLAMLNFLLHASDLTRSPLFPLGFTVAVVLLLNPLKDHLQNLVDRLFFRLRYNPQKVLEQTGEALASNLHLDAILSVVWNTIRENLGVHHGGIFLLAPESAQYVRVYPRGKEGDVLPVTLPALNVARQRHGVLTCYDLDSTPASSIDDDPPFRLLAHQELQLLVLLRCKGDVIGMVVLGRKESGGFFSAADRDFLVALANQGALAVANALSYQEIQALNASLERKVTERTQELAQSNTELHDSLVRLEQAYRDLQRSQDSLVRAEKMAALGRLTAGIAHEINTPLGATLTALKLLGRLVAEHRTASVHPSIAKRSPQEIDAEMEKILHSTQQWMDKAASYIRSLKLHTRDLQRGEERSFSVIQTLEETTLLLAHRLRLGQCSVVVSSTVQDPVLHGDPGKLGQVLTNLIVNAIDAYQATNAENGEIRIDLTEDGDELEIRVADQGCGIPQELSERIFEEFFSTKPLGEGTGLGLSITRDIVANFFSGTIRVASTPGQGSVFVLRFPRRGKHGNRKSLLPQQTAVAADKRVVEGSEEKFLLEKLPL